MSRLTPQLRQAATVLAAQYGVDPRIALDTAEEAAGEGLTVEETARRLYAYSGGSLTLARCREAVCLLPLRSRYQP